MNQQTLTIVAILLAIAGFLAPFFLPAPKKQMWSLLWPLLAAAASIIAYCKIFWPASNLPETVSAGRAVVIWAIGFFLAWFFGRRMSYD